MRIVYYTSGSSGFGRTIIGISIGNALKRKNVNCNYTIACNSPKAGLLEDYNFIDIPIENEVHLSRDNYHNSTTYKKLSDLKPDVLIINHNWFMIHSFIDELDCKKIYISDSVYDSFFSITLKNEELRFRKDDFDRIIAIEPFNSSIDMELINPLIMKNRDEILSRERALEKLGKDGEKMLALYGLDGHPYDSAELRKKYIYLKDAGYDFIYPGDYGSSIYPLSDYYNALDFLINGGGYTQFWEAVFFQKEAVFEPFKLNFSNQTDRIKYWQEFYFDENGADQLVDIMMHM